MGVRISLAVPNKNRLEKELALTDQMRTHVNFLLDESGSMDDNGMAGALREGFNGYVKGLLEDTEVEYTMTVAKFTTDNGVDMRYSVMGGSNIPVKDVVFLTEENYVPFASTPLYDAIARIVKETEVPEGTAVLTVIYTDGLENASREFSSESINKLILDSEAKGWTFLFMGAAKEAWGNAHIFHGTVASNNMMFAAGAGGTASATAQSLTSTRGYSRTPDRSAAYQVVTDEQRLEVEKDSD